MTVHVVWHPSCRLHNAGAGHPERPERLEAVLESLRAPDLAPVLAWVDATPAPREALERGVADAITFPWHSLIRPWGIDKAVTYHLDLPLYVTPFVVMATLYALSAALFWIWFRPVERGVAYIFDTGHCGLSFLTDFGPESAPAVCRGVMWRILAFGRPR